MESDLDSDLKLDLVKVLGLAASFINIFGFTPLFFGIIWYEKHGTGMKRTLINQLLSSSCWILICYNFIVQTSEVALTIVGPMDQILCRLQLFFRNTLVIHYNMLLLSVSIIKYFYIFVIKSPTGLKDAFWYYFINLTVFLFASISQSVYQFLPGRNPYFFYTCSGVVPDQNQHIKFNYFLSGSLIIAFVVYIIVLVKIKIYECKDPIPTVSHAVSRNEQVVTNKFYCALNTLNNSLASLTTLAISLSVATPFVGLLNVLNMADPDRLGQFPFHQLAFTYQQIMPAILNGAILIFYFKSQHHMRKTLYKKFRKVSQNFWY